MADNAKDQLLEDIRKKARNLHELTDNEWSEVQEKIYSDIEQENWGEARTHFNDLENNRGWDLSEEKQFLNSIAQPGELETIDDGDLDKSMPKREKLVLKRQVEQSAEDELLARTDKQVGVESLFNIQESLYRDTGKTAFIVSAQKEYQGRVSVALSETRQKFELMSVYENKDAEQYFKHFGQNNPNKGYNKVAELTKSFYQYKFRCNDKEYLALSTEKLDTVRCKLKGTKIGLNDYKTVGENRKLAVNQDIIFVHSVEPAIETMDDDELDRYKEDIDHDFLAEKLLGDWRQPTWYEKFMFADLAVNEENGFPSHVVNLSKPGTGKSKIIESQLRSMDENQKEPFTGSGSTVKGLVPSFKESPPDEGYLLKTQRIAGVDEKMDLLSNSIQQGNDASNDIFRPLLNLLTHDVRTFESGNGSIKGQMMSTMWATGNFNAYGIKNMKELAEKVDSAYLSRTIIYGYTRGHVEFINDRKAEVKQKMQQENLNEEDLFPERDDNFISMMDTMREDKHAQIDFTKVRKLHKELLEAVPGYMQEIFSQRGAHHMENILLGIVKYNYLVNNRDNLEAKEEDYEEMKKIFELIISSWDDVDATALSFEARKEALTPPQRRTLNAIEEEPGVDAAQLSENVDVDSLSWCLTSLKDTGLIASDDAKEISPVYPWWSEEFEELTEDEQEVIYE